MLCCKSLVECFPCLKWIIETKFLKYFKNLNLLSLPINNISFAICTCKHSFVYGVPGNSYKRGISLLLWGLLFISKTYWLLKLCISSSIFLISKSLQSWSLELETKIYEFFKFTRKKEKNKTISRITMIKANFHSCSIELYSHYSCAFVFNQNK